MDLKRFISSLPVPEWIGTSTAGATASTPAPTTIATRQESDDIWMPSTPSSNSSVLPVHGITTRQTSTPSTLALDDDTDTSVSTILTTTTASSVQQQLSSFSAADLEGFADSVQPGLDVFPGKGEAIKRLNSHYRILIRDYHLAYTGASSDSHKNHIALALLQDIQRKGGNFLKNQQGDYMSEKESLTKIKKALKDYKTRETRRVARQKAVARRLKRQSLTKQTSTRSLQTDISHISQSTSVADYSYVQDESCHPPSIAQEEEQLQFHNNNNCYDHHHHPNNPPPAARAAHAYPSTVAFAHEPLPNETPPAQNQDDAEWMEMIDLLSALE